MKYFVEPNSIVRKIWGSADTILFIFAGSAAEFALNKSVDWLYFTGRLPADPLGRLFSTVDYARMIVFSEEDEALRAIDKITFIHQGVEQSRGMKIPQDAYRDVLFMLIDYSVRAFEVLERRLMADEKEEIFEVFTRMGTRMQIEGLPATYADWNHMRSRHLESNLVYSPYTKHLYAQYKKHLGAARYFVLKQVQGMLTPGKVKRLLNLSRIQVIAPVLACYKFLPLTLRPVVRNMILPAGYRAQVKALDGFQNTHKAIEMAV